MMSTPLQLMGSPGSPYTRKMLALLRYRRIPHQVIWGGPEGAPAHLPKPKVALLPTVYFPDDAGGLDAMIDSTLIAQRLETSRAERSAAPADPVLRFVNALIEDYADEWLTKAMFHYRWAHAEDAAHAPPLIVHWAAPTLPATETEAFAARFAKRQIDRLHVVGSNDVTAETIETGYRRFLKIFESALQRREFLFGDRPATADFALFGQLTQLVLVDPTPTRLAAETAPRIRAWVERVEDLSGHASPDGWCDREDAKGRLTPLLNEIGRVYAPFLIANAAAARAGDVVFEAEIDGRAWRQPVFPYQVKCLGWLQDAYAELSGADRAACDAMIAGTGCEALFAAA